MPIPICKSGRHTKFMAGFRGLGLNREIKETERSVVDCFIMMFYQGLIN